MNATCPSCGESFTLTAPVPELSVRRTGRPGGRQISFERAVRILAWSYLDEGSSLTEANAMRKARRVLTRALPAKQRLPRKQPADLRKVA